MRTSGRPVREFGSGWMANAARLLARLPLLARCCALVLVGVLIGSMTSPPALGANEAVNRCVYDAPHASTTFGANTRCDALHDEAAASRVQRSSATTIAVRPAAKPAKTSGVLKIDGESIPLTSGTGRKEFSHYPAYNHVEGQAAILMRQRGARHADLIMDNPNGICPLCNSNVPSLLPEGATLSVRTPAGTVPKRGWQNSRTFTGNTTDPLAGR